MWEGGIQIQYIYLQYYKWYYEVLPYSYFECCSILFPRLVSTVI